MQCSVASNPGLAQPNTDQMSLSSSNSTDDAERTASISEASDCLIANETKLVNEFIRIADAGNANQEGDRGKIVDQLILSAWHLTSFVPTPNFADQQLAAREIIAAHGFNVEAYEYWIAQAVGHAFFRQAALDRAPPTLPKAWFPVIVTPHKIVTQACAADILRTALKCGYDGPNLRAILDRILGVQHMIRRLAYAGYSSDVKMRLEAMEIIFIGDNPPNRARRYELKVDKAAPPVTKASQVVDLLKKYHMLPQGWEVVSPLTCVDPFYYDAHVHALSEEPMPTALDERGIRWLGDVPDGHDRSSAADHGQAIREAARDTALEAVTSTRTTLQLVADVVGDSYHTSTMMWIGLMWGVDGLPSPSRIPTPPAGPWVPRSEVLNDF